MFLLKWVIEMTVFLRARETFDEKFSNEIGPPMKSHKRYLGQYSAGCLLCPRSTTSKVQQLQNDLKRLSQSSSKMWGCIWDDGNAVVSPIKCRKIAGPFGSDQQMTACHNTDNV